MWESSRAELSRRRSIKGTRRILLLDSVLPEPPLGLLFSTIQLVSLTLECYAHVILPAIDIDSTKVRRFKLCLSGGSDMAVH